MASYTPVRLAYSKHEPVSRDAVNETPVIFLHGLSVTKEHWADIPQIIANKTKRKVYALDARNHGDSEWSNHFSFDLNVDDLFHFMDTVGAKKAILVGHSMGGITSMKAALTKPERIERIVVEDIHGRKIPEGLAMLAIYMKHLLDITKDIPRELNEEDATRFCAEKYFQNLSKELKAYLERENGQLKPRKFFPLKKDCNGRYVSKTNFDVIVEALKKPDEVQSEMAGTYDGPAHFIYGKISVMNVPLHADYLKQFFPKAEFIGVEEAAHDVHNDSPEEFLEALLKCLA